MERKKNNKGRNKRSSLDCRESEQIGENKLDGYTIAADSTRVLPGR